MNALKRENKSKNKPIALIAKSMSSAFDHARFTLDVREIVGAKRRVTEKNGQVYFVVTEVKHLRDMEFSDIRVIPGASENPNFKEIYDYASTRKR